MSVYFNCIKEPEKRLTLIDAEGKTLVDGLLGSDWGSAFQLNSILNKNGTGLESGLYSFKKFPP